MRGCVLPFGKTHTSRAATQVVADEFFESCREATSDFSNWLANRPTAVLLAVSCVESALGASAPEGKANTFEGFDPGSERTLAAWIRHASRTRTWGQLRGKWRKGQ